MSSWFDQLDLGSLQDQLTKSVTEAQSLIGNVNNLDILNFDGMALQEEEDLKLEEEEEEEEEEEDDEQGVDDYIDENLQNSELNQVNSSSDDFVPIPTVIHENSSGHFGRSKGSKSVVRKLKYTDADREESPPLNRDADLISPIQNDEDSVNTNYNSPENVLLNTPIASTFPKDVSSNLPHNPIDNSDIPVETDGIDGEDQQSNSSSSVVTGATTLEYDSSGTYENIDMKRRDIAMSAQSDTNDRNLANVTVDNEISIDSKVKQDSQTASTPAVLQTTKSKYSSKRPSTTNISTPGDPHLTESIQSTNTPDFEYILPERHSTMPLRSIAKTNNMTQSPADIIADKSSKKGLSSVAGIEVQPKREKVKKIKEKKPKNLDFWGTSSKKTLKFVAPTVHTGTSNDIHTTHESSIELSGSHGKPHFSQISVGMLSDVYEAVVECDEDDDIQQTQQQLQQEQFKEHQIDTDNNTEYKDSNEYSYSYNDSNDIHTEGITTNNSSNNSSHILNIPQHHHTSYNDNDSSSITSSVANSAVSIYASMFSSASDNNTQSSSSASKYQSPSQPSTTPANTNSSVTTSNSSGSYIVNSFSFFDKVDTEIDLESDPIYNKVKANKQLPAATNMANAASMLNRLYASAAQTYHGRTLHPNVDGIVGTEQNPTIYQIFNNIVSNVTTTATDNVSADYSNSSSNGNSRQATFSNNSNNNSNNNFHDDDTEAADTATLQPAPTSTTLNRAALRTLLLNYLKHCLLYIWDHMFTTEGISVITGLLLFYSYYKFQRYGTDAGDR